MPKYPCCDNPDCTICHGSGVVPDAVDVAAGQATEKAELLNALRAARPLLVACFDAYTSFRDQLREGRVPTPIPAFEGEDRHCLDVIERLTALLRKHEPAYPVGKTLSGR